MELIKGVFKMNFCNLLKFSIKLKQNVLSIITAQIFRDDFLQIKMK